MFLLASLALAGTPDRAPVDAVLDRLHQAATEADEATYFDCFTEDAIFVGTDPTERWEMTAFRAFAAPAFEEAPAWAYTPVERHVDFGPRGRVAWFHEVLEHDRYGRVRGSGVLVRNDGDWAVSQYVLSFPIPNNRALAVLDLLARPDRTLPPLFTPQQLRDAHPVGLKRVWRAREATGPWVQELETVIEADATSVTFATDRPRGGGKAPEFTATWTELARHAAFPVVGTTWTPDVQITVPAGTFRARSIRQRGEEGLETTLFFALDLPGPPIRAVTRRDGVIVQERELVSVTPPHTAAPR